jgi:hypothetical protein
LVIRNLSSTTRSRLIEAVEGDGVSFSAAVDSRHPLGGQGTNQDIAEKVIKVSENSSLFGVGFQCDQLTSSPRLRCLPAERRGVTH